MSLTRAGMVCIRLNDRQMALLATEADLHQIPVQIRAQQLLVDALEHRAHLRHNANLRGLTARIAELAADIAQITADVDTIETDIN